MSKWKTAFSLSLYEYKQVRGGYVLAVFMMIYLTLSTTGAILAVRELEITNNVSILSFEITTTFLMLALLSIPGMCLFQGFSPYWKTNIHSVQIAQWLSLPISPKDIVKTKLITMLPPTLLNNAIIFTAHGLVFFSGNEKYGLIAFISYCTFWLSFSVIMFLIYIFCEVSMSGKSYLIVCSVITFAMLVFAMIVSLYLKQNLLLLLMGQSDVAATITAAISLLLLIFSLFFIPRMMVHRIANRSILRLK